MSWLGLHGTFGTPSDFDNLKILGMDCPDLYAMMGSNLLSELGQRPWDSICGYSFGSRMAVQLALRFPRRVKRLLLLAGHPGISDPKERALRLEWDYEQARRLRVNGIALFIDYWNSLPLFEHDQDISQPPGVSEDQVAKMFELFGVGSMESGLHELLEIDGIRIDWVIGERDTRYRKLSKIFEGRVPIHIVKGAGHRLLQHADQIREIVL